MTHPPLNNGLNFANSATFFVTGALLFIFSILSFSEIYISGDVAWYLVAADRMLSGISNSEGFFDTNPPMSFLIYIPAIILEKISGIPKEIALLAYMYGIIFSNSVLLNLLLRKITNDKIFANITTLLYINVLIISYLYIGHKDHLIGMSIIAFMTAQFSINETKDENRRLEKGIMILNVPFLLVKPHYFIIPVFFIAFNALKTKSFRSLFRFDSYLLCFACLTYTAIVFIFFQDFLFNILPLASEIYAFNTAGLIRCFELAFFYLVITSILLGLITTPYILEASLKRRFLRYLLIAIALTIIVFVIQTKGFLAHLFPAYFMTDIALIIGLILFIQKFFKIEYLFIPFCVLLFINNAQTLAAKFNTNTTPFFQSINNFESLTTKENIASFYIESQTTDLAYLGAVYNNKIHASRFPSRWIIDFEESKLGRKNYKEISPEIIKKFGDMLVADWDRYNPDTLFLYDKNSGDVDNLLFPHQNHYSITHYLKDHPAFIKRLKNFTETGEKFTFNYAHALEDVEKKFITYKIYRKKPLMTEEVLNE